jgi:ABC-2 type transport system ATP-binding protein
MPENLIDVTNLRKTYGAKVAVADVSLTVRDGEIHGVLGPNGAGKTTTVECIAGLRTPDGGSVRVLGLDPVADRAKLTAAVGVQLQESELPERLKVGEALELYASFYADPADPAELLDRLGLTEHRDVAFAKLSGGQKQRVSIALALVGKPRIAILDELSTGLDPQARREVWDLIRQVRDSGVTIILVTHLMDEAEQLCDRITVIDAGRVVAADTPARLVAAVSTEQEIEFRVDGLFDTAVLTTLPEVATVRRDGDRVVVTGTGELLFAVVAALAEHKIVPAELHTRQASLDDAFVALAGRTAPEGISA